jgi:hypothetical protein
VNTIVVDSMGRITVVFLVIKVEEREREREKKKCQIK